MKKIMHVAEPFATGVLSFLVDITKRQVEKYEVYILYGIRPLTPDNVEDLFDKRVNLIKIQMLIPIYSAACYPVIFPGILYYCKGNRLIIPVLKEIRQHCRVFKSHGHIYDMIGVVLHGVMVILT